MTSSDKDTFNSSASVQLDVIKNDVTFVSPDNSNKEIATQDKKVSFNEKVNEVVEIPLRGSGKKLRDKSAERAQSKEPEDPRQKDGTKVVFGAVLGKQPMFPLPPSFSGSWGPSLARPQRPLTNRSMGTEV